MKSTLPENWIDPKERPGKLHVTCGVYGPVRNISSKCVLILPGRTCRDIDYGYEIGLIDASTELLIVESNKKVVPHICKHLKECGLTNYTLYNCDITQIDFSKHYRKKEGPEIDFAYLDLCNIYHTKLHNWIQKKLRPYLSPEADFAITLTNRLTPQSLWQQTKKNCPSEIEGRTPIDFLRDRVQDVLGSAFPHVATYAYHDSINMIVLQYKGKDMASNLTSTQRKVYDNLTPADKAAYTKALRNATGPGVKSNITKTFQNRASKTRKSSK